MKINSHLPVTMDNPRIKNAPSPGSWPEQKRKLLVQFPHLTESDLFFEEGKKDEMFARLAVQLNLPLQYLKNIMASL